MPYPTKEEVGGDGAKWIPGHEGSYAATRAGEILSYRSGKARPIKAVARKRANYRTVTLYRKERGKLRMLTMSARRAVYSAFNGEIPEDRVIKLIDPDADNVHALENLLCCVSNGGHKGANPLTDERVLDGRRRVRERTATVNELADEWDLDYHRVYRAVTGVTFTRLDAQEAPATTPPRTQRVDDKIVSILFAHENEGLGTTALSDIFDVSPCIIRDILDGTRTRRTTEGADR